MKLSSLIYAFGLIIVVGFSAVAQTGFDLKKLDSLFDALEAKNRMMGSVTLTKDGKVIYSRVLGFSEISDKRKAKPDSETMFRIGSVTKVYTAVMIWQLIEEKKLSLDTKLSEFFPKITNAEKITIGNLLSHTSGLQDYTNGMAYGDPKSWIFQPQTSAQMVPRFVALKPDFEPGERSRYSNTNYTLLGYVIESVTRSTYGKQLDSRIVKKLKLKRTRYDGKIAPEKNEAASYVYEEGKWSRNYEEELSVAGGAGGIVSTTGEMAKFINALGGEKLISRSSYHQMTGAFSDKFPDSHKGIALFTLRGINKKAISKQGGIDAFTSNVVYVPEDRFALALTINGNNYPMSKIFWNVMDIYYDRPVEIPTFNKFDLTAEKLSKFEGVFELKGPGIKITVKKDGNRISAQATGQDSFSLDPISESTFADEISGIILEFSKSPEGSLSHFTLYQGRNMSRWDKEK